MLYKLILLCSLSLFSYQAIAASSSTDLCMNYLKKEKIMRSIDYVGYDQYTNALIQSSRSKKGRALTILFPDGAVNVSPSGCEVDKSSNVEKKVKSIVEKHAKYLQGRIKSLRENFIDISSDTYDDPEAARKSVREKIASAGDQLKELTRKCKGETISEAYSEETYELIKKAVK